MINLEHAKEVMEKLVVPERRGVISSTRYRSIGDKIIQEIGVGFCDNCGYKLNDQEPLVVCNYEGCQKKLCTSHSCSSEYRQNYYCKEHMQALLPLSIHGFEVLHCIRFGLDSYMVRELAGIAKDDYRVALGQVLQAGYLVKRGISICTTLEITGKGALAWKTYFESFRQDGDVEYFLERVNSQLNGGL